ATHLPEITSPERIKFQVAGCNHYIRDVADCEPRKCRRPWCKLHASNNLQLSCKAAALARSSPETRAAACVSSSKNIEFMNAKCLRGCSMFEVSRHRLSLLVVTFFLALTCIAVAQEADKSTKKAKSGDDPAQDQQNVDPLKRQLPEKQKKENAKRL